MSITRNHRARGNRPKSFGSVLEGRGDYEGAKRAFESAGLLDEAMRVGTKLNTVAMAARLEENQLPHRAARLLLDAGLMDEAAALSGRQSGKKSASSRLAAGTVWARTLQAGNLENLAKDLQSLGSFGLYLIGRIAAEINPAATRRIADSLCGKPVPAPEKEAKIGEGGDASARMFMAASDPEEMARGMMSMLMWSMTSESEMLYYSLRLYSLIGDGQEARKCLSRLNERSQADADSMKFFMAGVYALCGKDAVLALEGSLVPKKHFSSEVLLTLYYAKEGVRGMEGAIHHWHREDAPEKALEEFGGAIYGENHCTLPVSEFLSDEEMILLIGMKDCAREAVLDKEEAKLAEYLAAYGAISDFSSVVKARALLQDVDFVFLKKDRNLGILARCGEAEKLADIASSFIDSRDAQLMAADIYGSQRLIPKAVACARRLFALGAGDEAEELIMKVSHSMGESDAVALGRELEQSHPLISLHLYSLSGSKPDFVRLANALLEGGDMRAIEKTAWNICCAWKVDRDSKRSLLMRDALLRLESFGDEGRSRAEGIRAEMTIGKLFIQTGLDGTG